MIFGRFAPKLIGFTFSGKTTSKTGFPNLYIKSYNLCLSVCLFVRSPWTDLP